MERSERAALYIFFIGVGVAVLGLAAGLAFPDLPRVICRIAFFGGGVVGFFATTFLIYDYWHVGRPKRLLPLIGVMVFVLVGLVGVAAYFWPISASVFSISEERYGNIASGIRTAS